MNAHGAVVRTANAAKERPVACRRSCIDIKELPRCVPNCLNQLGRDGGVLVLRWSSLDERRGEDQAGGERQAQNAFRRTVKQRCKFCFHFFLLWIFLRDSNHAARTVASWRAFAAKLGGTD